MNFIKTKIGQNQHETKTESQLDFKFDIIPSERGNFETFADTTHVELPTALPLLLIFDLLVPYGVNALASQFGDISVTAVAIPIKLCCAGNFFFGLVVGVVDYVAVKY